MNHRPSQISFTGGKGKPSFFAAQQTFNGPDTATLRYRALKAKGVKVHVEEEKSADRERNHANENVGYMALWDGCFPGPLGNDDAQDNNAPVSLGTGLIEIGEI